ncbi:MAG: hypothetical protein FRX49_10879 [Trebouxia sp. A1-2]|nr:MAG: hypothetical protein FRX49_10879 [Trebouxia sp. A1-2]
MRAQTAATAKISAAIATQSRSANRNIEAAHAEAACKPFANVKAQATAVRKKQQAVGEAQAKVAQAEAKKQTAQSCTPMQRLQAPALMGVMKPTDSASTNHPSEHKAYWQHNRQQRTNYVPMALPLFDPPKSTPAPSPTLSISITPAPTAAPAEQPSSMPLPKTCPSPTPTPAPTSPAEQANPLVPQDTLGALPPAYTPPTPPPVSTLSSTFPLSQSDIAIKAFDSQQSAPVPAASQANASISDQSSGKALTLQGASAPSLSRQDAEIADSNVMQTSASGAGLDKASTATDDWSTQLHEGVTQLSHATEAEKAHGDGNTTDAAEMILHPAADTMASPAAKAAQTEDSAQIGPQLPISGALHWLLYNPLAIPGGASLAALGLWLMHRR